MRVNVAPFAASIALLVAAACSDGTPAQSVPTVPSTTAPLVASPGMVMSIGSVAVSKCLTIGGTQAVGAALVLASCAASPAQQFVTTASADLRTADSTLCITAPADGASGAQPVLAGCTGASSQRWTRTSDGALSAASGGCLVVSGASATDDRIALGTCGHSEWQCWTVIMAALPVPPMAANYGTVTRVEPLAAMRASRLRRGLGFNVDPGPLWHLDLAKAAGATEVRMQFGWERVETAPGVFGLPQQFSDALQGAVSRGLEPLLLAAYGPGWAQLPLVSVGLPARVGDTVIELADTSSLRAITVGSAFVVRSDWAQLVGSAYAAYPGAFIKSVDITTHRLTLAAPLTLALKAGDRLAVHNRFYAPATTSDTDPSVQAYIRYVQYLASRVAALNSPGRVEIWNEPPWYGDRWDGGAACFSSDPAVRTGCADFNFAFARVLMKTTPPGQVRYNWGGTHKSGFATVMAGGMIGIQATRTHQEIVDRVAYESFHPYGSSPEHHAWDSACLLVNTGNIFSNCALPGTDVTSNFKWARKVADDNLRKTGWSVEQTITETGLSTTNQRAKANFAVRSLLAYMGLGFERVNFYKLVEGSSGQANYGFVDPTTRAPYLAYSALKLLMSDLDSLGVDPTVDPSVFPAPVVSHRGTWPLMIAPVVGRFSAGAKQNVLITFWQRSYPAAGKSFDVLPATVPGLVHYAVPAAFRVVRIVSLIDRSIVPYTTLSNGAIDFEVKDEPLGVTLIER